METMIKNISVVLPCFNEEEAIPTVIPRVQKSLQDLKDKNTIEQFELIVVNDKSTDQSGKLLSQFDGIKILDTKNQTDRGYGLALKKGFDESKNQWIAFLDVDNSYRPEDLETFILEANKGESDFIMGSRSFAEKGMSFTRGMGNWLYVISARLLYGSHLDDVCSGFRLFNRRHLNEVLDIPEDGLDFSIHLTLKMLMNKVKIQQIPIQYDQRLGNSKLSVFNDGLAFLKVLLTLKLRRVRGLKHSQV